jgi:dihydrofolate reductase
MGFNTFKSIGGKPLPDRKNIILNNDPSYVPPEGCFVAHSIDELMENSFEGDTYFPEVNAKEWKEVRRTDHKADEKNKYDYSFAVLERISA